MSYELKPTGTNHEHERKKGQRSKALNFMVGNVSIHSINS